MQEQKRYHQRKLAIIEMIEECDRCISNANYFIEMSPLNNKNGLKNIARYERIKKYLVFRYYKGHKQQELNH